jgi:hypothetical protein
MYHVRRAEAHARPAVTTLQRWSASPAASLIGMSQLKCWLLGEHNWMYLWTREGVASFKCRRCELRRKRVLAAAAARR